MGGFILLLNAINILRDEEVADSQYTFTEIRKMLPPPVNDLLSRPIFLGYAFPRNGSAEKKQCNTYKQHRKITRRVRNMMDLDEECQEEIEEEGMTNAEIQEYAYGNVKETSSTPTIPVIKNTLDWIDDLKNGREANGEILKTTDGIDSALAEEKARKSSTLYKLKKLKVQDKCLNLLCNRFTFDNPNQSPTITRAGTIYIPHPEPIIVPVLKATNDKRQELINEYLEQYDFSKIRLDKLVSEMDENDVKVAREG